MTTQIQPKRKKWITIRMSDDEHKQASRLAAQTTCQSLSEYARKTVLARPVVLKYRNESLDDFLSQMGLLKNELNHLNNQFTQSVQRLHTLRHLPDIQQWILHNEQEKTALQRQIDRIFQKINQAYELWSHV